MDTNQHEPLEGMTHVTSWIRMLTQSEKEGTGWETRRLKDEEETDGSKW